MCENANVTHAGGRWVWIDLVMLRNFTLFVSRKTAGPTPVSPIEPHMLMSSPSSGF